MSRNIRIINHSMAYNGIIIILSLCITIQKEAKCSQNEMDNIEKLMKSHEVQAESRNGSACYVNVPQQYIEEIQKLDRRFGTFCSLNHKFSNYLCKYVNSMHFNDA
ncbi:unnamed protein product [Schistosoma rodhaini]|nr:unnamed protein product [Schistosoma rodhaini]